jgi:hypothetical protein
MIALLWLHECIKPLDLPLSLRPLEKLHISSIIPPNEPSDPSSRQTSPQAPILYVPANMEIINAFKVPMDPLWVYIVIRWYKEEDEYPDVNALLKFLAPIPGVAGQLNKKGPTLKRISATDWDGCLELKKEIDDNSLSRLTPHSWVRALSPGPYRNDVGWLVDLNHPLSTDERPLVTVLMLPQVRVRREHPSGFRLLVKTAFEPPPGPPIYRQKPIQNFLSDVVREGPRSQIRLTQHGLLLRAIAPGKLSHNWSDGMAVSPPRFQLWFFIPDLKQHGDVSHIHKVAPLPEQVHFGEGDKVGLLGHKNPTLEFVGIFTGLREGSLWTAKDASEGEDGDPDSYHLYDEARLVKYFHPMEYAASLRDGRSGIVVSIDRFGVATLLIHDRSEADEQEIRDAV